MKSKIRIAESLKNTLRRATVSAALLALPLTGAAEPFTASVYEEGSSHQNLLFKLKRDESGSSDSKTIATRFTTPDGVPAVDEKAELQAGKLRKYVLEMRQLGETGTLEIKDGKAFFSYTKDGRTRTDDEDMQDNLVVGPTTMAYLQKHWDEILQGKDVTVRYAALDRLETVGFKFFKIAEETRGGVEAIQVKMKPTSVIIAAVVKPLIFTFDKKSAKLLEMHGRTLPKRKVGDKWQDLDAEIVYQY